MLSGTSCHTLMLQWVRSPSIARFLSLALPLSHPDVHSALNLSSFCCCIINPACLNLIGLSLTSQSIAQIPLLLPRVFTRSSTNNKSLASSLTKYFFIILSLLKKNCLGESRFKAIFLCVFHDSYINTHIALQ